MSLVNVDKALLRARVVVHCTKLLGSKEWRMVKEWHTVNSSKNVIICYIRKTNKTDRRSCNRACVCVQGRCCQRSACSAAVRQRGSVVQSLPVFSTSSPLCYNSPRSCSSSDGSGALRGAWPSYNSLVSLYSFAQLHHSFIHCIKCR